MSKAQKLLESLSHEEVLRDFSYNPETGIVTRLTGKAANARAGEKVGWSDRRGYLIFSLNKVKLKLHRFIWFMETGYAPSVEEHVDHEDHITHNNTWSNLRLVDVTGNQKNRSLVKGTPSGFMGVTWSTAASKWQVRIHVGGKQTYLGLFTDKNEAVKARQEANITYGYHKNHGRLNGRTINNDSSS